MGDTKLVDLPFKDRNAIGDAVKYLSEYGEKMTAKDIHTLRQKLDSLIGWDSGVSNA